MLRTLYITYDYGQHTFDTIALKIGILIDVISKILGQKDLKVMQMYLKYPDDLKIQKKIGKILF